jgi:tetratricopeptide (TPR) repeat protein
VQRQDVLDVGTVLQQIDEALLRGARIAKECGERRDYAVAEPLLTEALALLREAGDLQSAANTLNNLGIVARERGDLVRARAVWEECLAIRRTLGETLGLAGSLFNLGLIAVE